MRTKLFSALLFALVAVTSLSAHIVVAPLQSKAGAVQRYELRVHNEAKVAATSVELEIPEGISVTDVPQPASGTCTTTKDGDRISRISWTVEVPSGKYLALPFMAKNPDGPTELHWSIRERLGDGTVVYWSDTAGADQKGSVTKIESTTGH